MILIGIIILLLILGITALVFYIIQTKKCSPEDIFIPNNGLLGDCPKTDFVKKCNIECSDDFVLVGDSSVKCEGGIVKQNDVTCTTKDMKTDCEGEWGEWSDCDCETRLKEREYTIKTPAAYGGKSCLYLNGEKQSIDCDDDECVNESCSILPPLNGNLGTCESTTISKSTSCELQCNEGYSFDGLLLQPYCNEYGSLISKDRNNLQKNNYPRVVCSLDGQCNFSIPINLGVLPGDCTGTLNTNESCTVECDDNHTLVGTNTITCNDSVISNNTFQNICEDKCDITRAIPSETGITLGNCPELLDSGGRCKLGCDTSTHDDRGRSIILNCDNGELDQNLFDDNFDASNFCEPKR